MCVKKTLVILLFISFICYSSFASISINNQKLIDFEELNELKEDYILDGKTLPSTVYPYTQEEANLYKSFINQDRDEFEIKRLVNVGIELYTAAEFYLHLNKKLQTTNIAYPNKRPLLNVSLNLYSSDFLYLQFAFNFKEINKNFFVNNEIFNSNIFFLPPSFSKAPGKGFMKVINTMSFDSVSKAYVNAGGKNWNILLGRNKANQGNGLTGNLVLGNNLDFHDMIQASTFWETVKYSFISSFFVHPKNYNKDNHYGKLNGLFFFMQHKIELSLIDHKLHLALAEGVMYQSEDNTFDLRVFSPLNFFHGFSTRGNGNSIVSLDVDYTIIPGLNIYTQIALDEFNIERDMSASRNPNAMAGLLGLNYYKRIKNGIFYLNTEGVYVSPWMYLRERTAGSEKQLPFIMQHRYFTTGNSMKYDRRYLGYTYGNDSAVFALKSGYKVRKHWSPGGSFTYIVHGTHDAFTLWKNVTDIKEDWMLTTKHTTKNIKDTSYSLRDSLSHTIRLGANGSYTLENGLNFFGNLTWEGIFNYKNISANKFITDIKLDFGLEYKASYHNLT